MVSQLTQKGTLGTRTPSGVSINSEGTVQAPRCRDIRYYPQDGSSNRSSSRNRDARRRVVAPVLPTHPRGNTQNQEPLSLQVQIPETAVAEPGVGIYSGESAQHRGRPGANNSGPEPQNEEAAGVEDSAGVEQHTNQPPRTAGVVNSATPVSATLSNTEGLVAPRRYTIPPLNRPPVTDEELVKTGDDLSMGDRHLLTRVVGRQPTSLRLHTIRDAWDALILHEVRATDEEAERLKAQATQYPPGSRAWRLLREEARRLEQHGVLTRMWIGNRAEPPGPHIHHPQDIIHTEH